MPYLVSESPVVNTDAFAVSENVQIQMQQIPTPPTFSAVETYWNRYVRSARLHHVDALFLQP